MCSNCEGNGGIHIAYDRCVDCGKPLGKILKDQKKKEIEGENMSFGAENYNTK